MFIFHRGVPIHNHGYLISEDITSVNTRPSENGRPGPNGICGPAVTCLGPVQQERTSLRSWKAGGRARGGQQASVTARLIINHSANPLQLPVMETLRGKAGAGGSSIKEDQTN